MGKDKSFELNEEQIGKLKKKFGTIYKLKINNKFYIIKQMSRSEYVTAMEKETSSIDPYYERQEEIAKAVTIYPSNIEELLSKEAGLASIISGKAMDISGFDLQEVEEL